MQARACLLWWINTLSTRQNGRHFSNDTFKCIFLNENVWNSFKTSLKFVPQGPINNIPALVQIMAWRCLGNKPLSEPMMIRLPTHICITRPQWVKMQDSMVRKWSRGGCKVSLHLANSCQNKIFHAVPWLFKANKVTNSPLSLVFESLGPKITKKFPWH